MTPKEKAKELYNKFYNASDGAGIPVYKNKQAVAKACALIAVDEVLGISYFEESQMSEDDDLYKNYWKQVKTEIEKL